jgi:GNAT superfamily N-acetyltransferase
MTRLRRPEGGDAVALAELMTQLGYPCPPDAIPPRLQKLANDPDVLLTVAEHEGRVVGIVTGHILHAIHKSEPVAMLTALVVLEHARGLGIGKALVAHVEDWARTRGASAMTLTSALRRSDAHAFYRRLGYEHTGLRLARSLV